MRRRLLFAAPWLAVPVARAAAPMKVVATFSILADLVAQLAGPLATVDALVGPGADVHTFQPRPSDLARLKAAAMVVENGLGLEGWINRLVRSAGFTGRRVVASTGIAPRTLTEGGRAATDPHIWQDPRNAVIMVKAIAAGLSAADPANADAYTARATAFTAEITAADAEVERTMAAIPAAKRQVITTHDAFGYYGARYGIAFRAAQGISTESEPTPKDLARLAAQIRRDKIRAVFIETMTDPRLAQTLARESGAVVGPAVYSDSLSPPGGPADTYLGDAAPQHGRVRQGHGRAVGVTSGRSPGIRRDSPPALRATDATLAGPDRSTGSSRPRRRVPTPDTCCPSCHGSP